jgi:hypothetical protein
MICDTLLGFAYVFQSTDGGSIWSEMANLTANSQLNDLFGVSVTIFRDTIAVGAVGANDFFGMYICCIYVFYM